MPSEVVRLINSRRYAQALARIDDLGSVVGETEKLRLRRQCLARMRLFKDAAICGDALLRHHADAAQAEDCFRQAQILLECRNWPGALEVALAGSVQAPEDARFMVPLVQAVLGDPSLFDRLAEGIARLFLLPGTAAIGSAGRQSQVSPCRRDPPQIFVPLRLPYYRPYDGAHPGTMGMVERATGLSFHIPDRMDDPWWRSVMPALRSALPLIESLMELHPSVDRAAAARYVADRFPTLVADHGGARLDFLSNLPMTLGQRPWVLWFDILGTLFQPFQPFENLVVGRQSPEYWIVKGFLESPFCRRIITHYSIDNHPLDALFCSNVITNKLVFINPYHSLGGLSRRLSDCRADSKILRMLFTSSFQNRDEGFFHRGGIEVTTAFLELSQDHEDIELVIRGSIPDTMDPELRKCIIKHPRIRLIETPLPEREYQELMSSVDIFLLPSVVLFRNGLVQAMQAGQVPVVADVEGIGTLVRDGENGLVVPGRRALSRVDRDTGTVRHDWLGLLQAVSAPTDPEFYTAFKEKLRSLIDNRQSLDAMSARNLARFTDCESQSEDLERFVEVMTEALDITEKRKEKS